MGVFYVIVALTLHFQECAAAKSRNEKCRLDVEAGPGNEESACLLQSRTSHSLKIGNDANVNYGNIDGLASQSDYSEAKKANHDFSHSVDFKSNATQAGFCKRREDHECCSLTFSVLDGGCNDDEYCDNHEGHVCYWCFFGNKYITNPARCRPRIPDGQPAWRPVLHTYAESCLSGSHICGTCGEKGTLPAGKKCYSHDNCQSGCCEGFFVTGVSIFNEPEHCFGKCKDKTPDQCVKQIEDSWQDAAKKFDELVKGIKKCNDPPPPSHTDTAEIENKMGNGVGCTSRNVGQFGLDLQCQPQVIPIPVAPVESPHQFELGCAFATCPGGAAIGIYGDFNVAPFFSFKADQLEAKYDVTVAASVNASIGISVGVHTNCKWQVSYVFPEQPTPVVTACGGNHLPMCITFSVQVEVEFLTDLKVSLTSVAQYYTNFTIGGQGIFDLTDAGNPKLDGRFIAEKKEEWWSVEIEGGGTALVQVRIAPLLTFLTVPGSFVTIHPYIIAELSAAGHMKYVQTSGSAPPRHLAITHDTKTAWLRIMKSKKRKDPSCEELVFGPEFEVPSPLSGSMEDEFLAKGHLTEGAGFFLPTDHGNGMCFATAVSLRAGATVHGLGPPRQIGDLNSFFKDLCTFFGSAMAKLGNIQKVNCYRQALGLGDIVEEGVAICHKIADIIPFIDIPVIGGSIDGSCHDVFTTFIGHPNGGAQCLCKVGCDRTVDQECSQETIEKFETVMQEALPLPIDVEEISEETLTSNFTKRKPNLGGSSSIGVWLKQSQAGSSM